MFGSLRFILALMVVLSHLQMPTPMGLNVGVIAVVVFYMLAGYVVAQLLTDVFRGKQCTWRFYQDRALRVLPLYWLAMMFAGFEWWFLDPKSLFLSGVPSFSDWIANLFVVPLNFYMFTGQDRFTLLPPAWSLGAELQFYLLIPLLLSCVRCRHLLLSISIVVFIFAQLGYIDSDIYGYRLLLGILFIFYIGVLIFQRNFILAWIISIVFLIYAIYLIESSIATHFLREVAIGVAAGIPLIIMLSPIRSASSRIKWYDARLGSLSYGIFLFHFPMIWLVQALGVSGWLLQALLVFWFSVLFAILGHYFVERPIWRQLRRDYRG